MKIKTTYPGQDERIIDAPQHIESMIKEGKTIPFNEPFTGSLKDDHGRTIVFIDGKMVAIRG